MSDRNTHDRVVLQLNAAALGRLLSGDTELEVQLRHQVVQEFAKRYLKDVAVDPALKLIVDAHAAGLKREVIEQIGTRVYDGKAGRYVYEVRQQVRAVLEGAAVSLCAEVVAEQINPLVEKYRADARERTERYEARLLAAAEERVAKVRAGLDRKVDERLDAAFERRVQAEVQRRLDAAAADKPHLPKEAAPDGPTA